MTKSFSKRQLEALEALKSVYPSGIGIEDPWGRSIFQSLVDRDSGLVELVDSDETPTGDCFVLTHRGADQFREGPMWADRN